MGVLPAAAWAIKDLPKRRMQRKRGKIAAERPALEAGGSMGGISAARMADAAVNADAAEELKK